MSLCPAEWILASYIENSDNEYLIRGLENCDRDLLYSCLCNDYCMNILQGIFADTVIERLRAICLEHIAEKNKRKRKRKIDQTEPQTKNCEAKNKDDGTGRKIKRTKEAYEKSIVAAMNKMHID